MDLETWFEGKMILESENFVENTFFVLSGRIKISVLHPQTGREQTLFLYSRGDIFDIVSFLDGKPTEGILYAIDDLQLLRIRSTKLMDIVQDSKILNQNMFRYLAKQLRTLEDLSTDLSIHDVPTRLVNLILKHTDSSNHGSKLKLIHDFTHEELAKLIGSSRVVVNRIMQLLKKQGHVNFRRGHIEILDVHKLLKEYEDKLKK